MSIKPPPRHSVWRLTVANFYDLRLLLRESWVALLGFTVLALVGTLYLMFGYNDYDNSTVARFSPLSALFETLRMLVLQSGLPLPQNDRLGQFLFFLLPLLGLALVFQSVLNFGRYLLDKGSRREAWQVALASTYRNHVIVCGLGRVGYRVVTQLRETGYEVVVIELGWSGDFVASALALRVPVVLGDARQATILGQAGVSRARGLVAVVGNDVINIEIGLVARRIQSNLQVVLRIFDDLLDSSMERSFGPNSVFSSSALAAPTLAAATISRSIAHVLSVEGRLIGLAEVTVEAESQLTGFVRAAEERLNVRLLHHTRQNGSVPSPNQMSKLESGDRVVLLGSLGALERARQENQAGSKSSFLARAQLQHPSPNYDTVIICGLGRVGYRVLDQLYRLSTRPQIVVVTGRDTRQAFLDVAASRGIRVVLGDARQAAVLKEAGLERAYSVAAVTSSDLVNIRIGLSARRMRQDVHLVLRVFSDVLAERLASLFGIHTAYSTSELAAPTLAASGVLGNLSHAVQIGSQLFGQVDHVVGPGDGLVGCSVADLRGGSQALVLAIQRSGSAVPPQPDTQLGNGDRIVLLAPLRVLARLRAARSVKKH